MKMVATVHFIACIVYLQTFGLSWCADQAAISHNGSYIDFIYQPEDTVENKLIPVLLNCSIGLYSAATSIFDNVTLPANISWYKNDILLSEKDLASREHLFSNGSLKIYPRNYRTISVYRCETRYKNLLLRSKKAQIRASYLDGTTPIARQFVSVCVGANINLNCTFDDAIPPPVITWYKNSRLVGSNEKFVDIWNTNRVRNRFLVLPNGVLELTQFEWSNAGKYVCYAENGSGRKKGSQYVLTVQNNCSSKELEPHFLTKPQDRSGILGQQAVFQCSATGDLPHYFQWFKNLTEIDFSSQEHLDSFQPGNSSLRELRMFSYDGHAGKFLLVGRRSLMITNLNLKDSGKYFCSVRTSNSSSLLASARLAVLEPPRFLEEPIHSRQAHIGCQISFLCNVTGWPKPSITWYKNGDLMVESNRVSFLNNSMLLRVLSKDDAGAYQCFADNEAGSAQSSFQLHVLATDDLDDPAFTDVLSRDGLLRLTASTPSSATLTWRRFGLLHPSGYKVNWQDSANNRQGVIQTPEQPLKASLEELSKGATIKVSVTPFTPVCEGPPSPTITFTTPQQEEDSPDAVRNLAVEALSSTGIWVTWNPPLDRDEDVKYKIAMWDTNSDPSTAKEVLTSDTSQEYHGLQKYTSYSVKVAVVGENGDVRPYSSPVALRTLEDFPDEAPRNISIQPGGIDSVLIQWAPPSEKTINGELMGYNIKYKDLEKRKNYVVNLDGDMTQYLLKGLRSNTEYALRIQVRNGRGSSLWTKRIYFETAEDPKLETRAPGKPALLDTKTGSTEMMVMWSPPDDDVIVREYVIGWGESGPYEHVVKTEASQRYYHITGLVPDTEYFISVRAENKAGQGEEYHTDVRTKDTDDIVDELYPPLNVHVTVLTATTLNVTWHDTAREEQARYLVRYKTNVPEEPRVRFLNSSDISCIIHGLRPYTVYDISVKTMVDDRQSTWSMTETAKMKESKPGTPPTDLTLMPIDGEKGTSVQLNWQPPVEPNGKLNGYLVFYSTNPSSDIDDWVIEPVMGDKLSTTVEDLQEDTQYYFKALARNNQGVGPYSEIVDYRTPATAQSVSDSTTPFNLSKPIWYLIIGGAVLLLIIIVVVVIIVVYRKRRANNAWRFTQGKTSSGISRRPLNGGRSPSSTSWPLSSNNSRPSLRHLPPQNKQFELHSLHSPTSRFTQEEFPNFCSTAPPEVIPLTETQYRYDYQRVPVSSPLHDPLRPPITSNHSYPYNDHFSQESTRVPLRRDISCEMDRYTDFHMTPRGASVTTPTQIDHTGDSAYGSDHQHCHLTDNPHQDPGEVSLPRSQLSQNHYLQSNQRSNHERSSSLSISACSTTGSGSFSSLDSNDPVLTNVQQFLDDMRTANTVM